jgi:hypothetical protein
MVKVGGDLAGSSFFILAFIFSSVPTLGPGQKTGPLQNTLFDEKNARNQNYFSD